MNKALFLIPDISGFTDFINSTEIEHSQHIIAELLEIMIDSNIIGLTLAEIEGDALFFYKEVSSLDRDEVFRQVESLLTSFYSHLQLLKQNRICPCHACAIAPELELKIILHYGEVGYLKVKEQRKPFGKDVIIAHRLLKNKIGFDHYVLFSGELWKNWQELSPVTFHQFLFKSDSEKYDGQNVNYYYAVLNPAHFNIENHQRIKMFSSEKRPNFKTEITIEKEIDQVYEYLTNYKYRGYWQEGVDVFEYDPDEVTRIGTTHVCVIDQREVNFEVVKKQVEEYQRVYGEKSSDVPFTNALYSFFILEKKGENQTKIIFENYMESKGIFSKAIARYVLSKKLKKAAEVNLENFKQYVEDN